MLSVVRARAVAASRPVSATAVRAISQSTACQGKCSCLVETLACRLCWQSCQATNSGMPCCVGVVARRGWLHRAGIQKCLSTLCFCSAAAHTHMLLPPLLEWSAASFLEKIFGSSKADR
jgi:hypothetical protein